MLKFRARVQVQVLRKLHHRNIVQFYGANLEPGSMFFVTELMKGGDLYSALRHHPETMRWDRLGKKVALDTALGINYLHTRYLPYNRPSVYIFARFRLSRALEESSLILDC